MLGGSVRINSFSHQGQLFRAPVQVPSFISSEGQQVQQFRIPHQCGRMLISLILQKEMPPTEESILFLDWWARRRCLLPIQYHVKAKDQAALSSLPLPPPFFFLPTTRERKPGHYSAGAGSRGRGVFAGQRCFLQSQHSVIWSATVRTDKEEISMKSGHSNTFTDCHVRLPFD